MQNNIKDFYKGKKVYLTGHTGFKGSWMVLFLEKLGAEVYSYALEADEISMFNLCDIKSSCVSSEIGDIRDYKKFEKSLTNCNPDIIFHMSAQSLVLESYDNPIDTIQSNVIGTANLFEIIRKNNLNVKSVINVTSDKCYENKEWIWPYRESDSFGGFDPYSASKGMCEILSDSYRRSFFNKLEIPIVSCRAGNVVGGGDFCSNRIVPDLIRSTKKGEELEIRSPNAVRPWQHVFDILYAYILAAYISYDNIEHSQGYNFAPIYDQDITVKELIDNINLEGAGYSVVTSNAKVHEAHYLRLDSTKSRNTLKWKNYLSFDELCLLTNQWYDCYLKGGDLKKISSDQVDNYFNLFED